MKNLLKKALLKLGYQLQPVSANPSVCTRPLGVPGVIDIEEFADSASFIPSMLSRQTAISLYTLCYLQELKGDVVEIGSWQGYSTSFLAKAVRDSQNGILYAIDHFKGNVGKEHFYVVGRPDLSDLRQGFERNLSTLHLEDSVCLLDMPSEEAIKRLSEVRVRFLFIDGDHSKRGVEKDISLFFPLLLPGAIIVFDDFAAHFSGLVEALAHLIQKERFERVFTFHNTLILKR